MTWITSLSNPNCKHTRNHWGQARSDSVLRWLVCDQKCSEAKSTFSLTSYTSIHHAPKHYSYVPPKIISKIIVIAFAAITGTFRYWTACNRPMTCTCSGRCDGSHCMLLTSSSPYFARNLLRFKIKIALVHSKPAYKLKRKEITWEKKVEGKVKYHQRLAAAVAPWKGSTRKIPSFSKTSLHRLFWHFFLDLFQCIIALLFLRRAQSKRYDTATTTAAK